MKTIISGAAALLLLLTLQPAFAAPTIPITRAIEMAEETLRAKGMQGRTYIRSISYERVTVLKPRGIWVISWADSIPGSKPGSKEVGLEIDMAGEVVHVLSGHGKKTSNTPH